MNEKTKELLANVPEYKRIVPERAWDELQTITSNLEIPDHLKERPRDFEDISSPGEDASGLINVPNFALNNREWSETIPDEL